MEAPQAPQAPQPEHSRRGNTKLAGKRTRAWCFTINNFTGADLHTAQTNIETHKGEYIIGKEIGEETKTPHLQGYIRFAQGKTFNATKKLIGEKAHLEEAKGSREDNYKYCSKQGDFITNIVLKPTSETHEESYEKYMIKKYNNVVWKPWQQSIIELIDEEADERKVYWYYETEGNTGKSFLTRYLDWKHDAIIANGKQSDVFNQYKLFLEEKKRQPKLAIIDIPRSHKDYICYSTFEKIKDGLFYSGKYEGGKLRLIPHHLIIFANFEPDTSKLSEDRWIIENIN